MRVISVILILFVFLGCGRGTNSSLPKYEGKAQLGVLAEATVKIYELDGVQRKLIATEVTSEGDSIETIGNFNVRTEKLEDDQFYLYEVIEGYDYDAEDDGIIDEFPTVNQGRFHLLAKGSSIKAVQSIRVTLISEIAYQKAIPFLEQSVSELEEVLKSIAQEIIREDINGDGFVGREDILRFDPVKDQSSLTEKYQDEFSNMILNILNDRAYNFEYDTSSIVPPTVGDVMLRADENLPIGSTIGTINLLDGGDSDILNYTLYGSDTFEIDSGGNVTVSALLNYEVEASYTLFYTASNHAGESERAALSVKVNDLYESSDVNYSNDEEGIQKALDNGDYDYVLTQLLNYPERYMDMSDDEIAMNIAGAYVGLSGYTVYDITAAIAHDENESNNSFNGFIDRITEDNDALETVNTLAKADQYYREVVDGLDCTNTSQLTEEQQASCFNLGLVRLTSLSNSVKLLFGGESSVVEAWANGVETNSSDDLNGNGVTDKADASACAIVYANDPSDSCRDGSIHTYRGKVTFTKSGVDYNTTLIEVDVGSAEHGYTTFYEITTNKANNNSPLLTNGVCDRNFNMIDSEPDGVIYFPCPVIDNGETVGLKESLEVGADIQSLFPDGSETQTTTENYINNITGSPDGTIGLDNLSDYLQRH